MNKGKQKKNRLSVKWKVTSSSTSVAKCVLHIFMKLANLFSSIKRTHLSYQ